MDSENSGNLKRWTVTLEQDGDDLILPLPQDLLDSAGWVTDDVLDWKDNGDGSWTLTKKNHTARAAIGERGFLIRTFDDRVLFRVYDHEHNFVDYEITNHDCEVVIIDPSAALIRNDAGDFLDYTAEALGIEKN